MRGKRHDRLQIRLSSAPLSFGPTPRIIRLTGFTTVPTLARAPRAWKLRPHHASQLFAPEKRRQRHNGADVWDTPGVALVLRQILQVLRQ